MSATVAATPDFVQRLRNWGVLEMSAQCSAEGCSEPAAIVTLAGDASLTPTSLCDAHGEAAEAAQLAASEMRAATLAAEIAAEIGAS